MQREREEECEHSHCDAQREKRNVSTATVMQREREEECKHSHCDAQRERRGMWAQRERRGMWAQPLWCTEREKRNVSTANVMKSKERRGMWAQPLWCTERGRRGMWAQPLWCTEREKSAATSAFHQPPVEEGVIDKGLQHSHQWLLVLTKHLHHLLTRHAVVAINACCLKKKKWQWSHPRDNRKKGKVTANLSSSPSVQSHGLSLRHSCFGQRFKCSLLGSRGLGDTPLPPTPSSLRETRCALWAMAAPYSHWSVATSVSHCSLLRCMLTVTSSPPKQQQQNAFLFISEKHIHNKIKNLPYLVKTAYFQ